MTSEYKLHLGNNSILANSALSALIVRKKLPIEISSKSLSELPSLEINGYEVEGYISILETINEQIDPIWPINFEGRVFSRDVIYSLERERGNGEKLDLNDLYNRYPLLIDRNGWSRMEVLQNPEYDILATYILAMIFYSV